MLILHQKCNTMIHIKELLKKRGITQAELANRLGINRIALNRTLSNPNIKLSTIEKIANAVGAGQGCSRPHWLQWPPPNEFV